MSYIGRKTLFLSSTVQLQHYKNFLILKGAFGILKIKINIPLNLNYKKNALILNPLSQSDFKNSKFKSLWGTLRARLYKVIQGLYKMHFIKLKFIGVGYKAFLKKNHLVFRLGFSHKLFSTLPKQVTIKKIKKRPPTFFFKSFDLNILKSTAFLIRSFKKPEPYKGKGIVLLTEFIKLKEGKKTRK